MGRHWGPGPVFVYESLLASRRWTNYALRAGFALVLVIGLAIAWFNADLSKSAASTFNHKDLARIGQTFYSAIAGIQLTVILLAAPAATAGAICLDRARGTLTHVLVTDLSDVEVVLGKLGARLVPVMALVATAVPVLALAGLLGGIVPGAVLSLFVVTIALAILGCSLALAFSVRVPKAHEVLMAVYTVFTLALVASPIWQLMAGPASRFSPPDWFTKMNPFLLAYAPVSWPGYTDTFDLLLFLGLTLVASALCVIYSILTLRREVVSGSGIVGPQVSKLLRGHKIPSLLPGPSLDGNPVLWREWRRQRPSRMGRILWWLYGVLAFSGTVYGIGILVISGVTAYSANSMLLGVVAYEVLFGLLFLSVAAPTVLTEERVRGSLDVLMATPLSTRSIVVGKWWGVFRTVLALAILPSIGAIYFCLVVPEQSVLPGIASTYQQKIQPIDRFAGAFLPITSLLCHGAAIASVGVACATWFTKPGRAIGATVAYYIAVSIVTIVLVETLLNAALSNFFGVARGTQWFRSLEQGLLTMSPFGGQIVPLEVLTRPWSGDLTFIWVTQLCVNLVTLAFAMGLLWLTILSFDRLVGRVRLLPDTFPPPFEPVDFIGSKKHPVGAHHDAEVVLVPLSPRD